MNSGHELISCLVHDGDSTYRHDLDDRDRHPSKQPLSPSPSAGHRGTSPPHEILGLLDRAEEAVEVSRQVHKRKLVLQGRTQINLFFSKNSTRTQSSFELAGKRLGADVMNMAVSQSSVKKRARR
ncbi:hypothetical protein QW131_06480 [Roseibium salinum]|nr:hypothetical protein [Roseibium salinum]